MNMETATTQLKKNGLNKSLEGSLDKVEPIYSSITATQEKEAIQKILEKYDSLRKLNTHFEDLQISPKSEGNPTILVNGSATYQEPVEPKLPEFNQDILSEQEISQVEIFFRSHKTYVYVCQCLANLYFTTVGKDSKPGPWTLARTGLPVLLLDKGETRARAKRVLQIVLAEKGSGFVLWKDIIDNLTNYEAQDSTFHTLYLSTDHRKMAGLSFDNSEASTEFFKQVDELTSDPLNISLSVPKRKGKPVKKKPPKVKLPKKCDISQPCCFQHITNVDIDDSKRLYTMATLVSDMKTEEENQNN